MTTTLRQAPIRPLFRPGRGPVVDRAAALAQLAAADPLLGQLIDRVGPLTLAPPAPVTPFQYLLRCIAGQQLSGRAAATIFGRFLTLYPGGRHPTPAEVLATPAAMLRSAGLSTAKALAIHDLARHAEAGTVPERRILAAMVPDRVIERLTRVRGVGPWTVEMLLIFYLGHPDILPVLDLGVRKGFARWYRRRRLPSAAVLTRHARRWRPYRSIASWYLWRALELPPD